jgi:hypothetical protein
LRQSTTYCPSTGNCNFTNNALNGNAVLYFQGQCPNGGSYAGAGVWTFTPATASFTATGDENLCGAIATLQASNAYSVAANGRVTIGAGEAFLYMVDTNRAFRVTTTVPPESATAEPQVGPIAVSSAGSAFGSQPPAYFYSLVLSGVQTVTATSSTTGNVTNATSDDNSMGNGLQENVAIANDTFTISATGRITFGSGTKVGYWINPTRTVLIGMQTSGATPTLTISDSQ